LQHSVACERTPACERGFPMKPTSVRPSLDDYITVPEAQALLGLTKQAVLYNIRAGHLAAEKMGGRYLVLRRSAELLRARRINRGLDQELLTVPLRGSPPAARHPKSGR
jgi:excisionase family DNA binding protein